MTKRPSRMRKTLEYLFVLQKGKRFLTLFLILLPLGFLLSVAMPERAFYEYFNNFVTGNQNYWNAWNFNGAINYMYSISAGIAALIVYVLLGSVCYTVISRSLRVGVFKVGNPIRECNESFFPTLYSGLFYIVLIVIAKALVTAITALFQNVNNIGTSMGLTIVAIVLTYIAVSYVLTIGSLFLPFMVFNGVNPLRAFVLSAGRISGAKAVRTFPQIFVPLSVTVLIGALVGIAENFILSVVIDALLYALLVVYLITYQFISYYTVNDIKREDYTREYYYKHGRD